MDTPFGIYSINTNHFHSTALTKILNHNVDCSTLYRCLKLFSYNHCIKCTIEKKTPSVATRALKSPNLCTNVSI